MRRNAFSMFITFWVFMFVFASNVFSQSSLAVTDTRDEAEGQFRHLLSISENFRNNSLRNELSPPPPLKLTKEEKQLLFPTKEEKADYAQFLKQKNTGLIRLLLQGKYKGKISINGNGSYYSFGYKTHVSGYGSDICFSYPLDFSASLGTEQQFGLISNLGDVAIEEITTDSVGVKFLFDFIPPSKKADINTQKFSFLEGAAVNGFNYRTFVRAKLNNTYVLRSINYDRYDVLVVFRVVKQDDDGSVTILWKRLKKFSTPSLKT